MAAGVQARLDGVTADAFHSPRDRSELLGLPAAGKIGYRDPKGFLQDSANISPFEAGHEARCALQSAATNPRRGARCIMFDGGNTVAAPASTTGVETEPAHATAFRVTSVAPRV
ncbi:hypothetical protein [Citricoccus sp. NR2]|uniref:hypothetical protein n=1 Tax=Citricoccus sp. NR2 TaxID=3004095 RepID=UPI0022DE8163|nr:hypothetical protein [Citricoccus sp. NR2]WBL17821.1 hypothetical protein O1A05_08345 [Citricoccus sp. NR2]